MGGNEEEGEAFSSYPSPITHYPSTHHGASRIRWDCRRGMLELDMVLARFLEQDFERLTPQEVEAFKGLLGYSDPDLWGMIQSGKPCGDMHTKRVLQLLCEC